MNKQVDKGPKLSIVVTSRNDNHGGDLNYRMQIFIDGILEQAKKFMSNIELIIVEWNPPSNRQSLMKELSWRKQNLFCDVRIIEVPNEIHKYYKYSGRLPLYQMIGKNVGIRRAKGEFILATNIDILFSDELFEFICSDKLQKGKIYRVNRYDVDNKIPLDSTNNEKLEYCKKNIIRVNERYYTRSFITNEEYLVYSREVREICEQNNFREPLFTNTCGDFQLMAKEHWFELHGYPEFDMYSMHIDSVFQYMACYNGIVEEVLDFPMAAYHIEHAAGFQPENKSLDKRLESDRILSLQYTDLLSLANKMSSLNSPLIFNSELWGLQDLHLSEDNLNKKCEEQKFINTKQNKYNPLNTCNTDEWIEKISNEMRMSMLHFNSKSFASWVKKIVLLNSFFKIQKVEPTSSDEISQTKLILSNRKTSEIEMNLIKTFIDNNRQIIIFGGSSGYINFVQPVLKYFNIKPRYIVDNDVKKIGTKIDGVEICNVERLLSEDNNVIILIASMFYDEIKKQLDNLGFKENINYIKTFLYHDITLNNIFTQLGISDDVDFTLIDTE